MGPDQLSASDHREQRMQAVAKLKRAASLPRMKDGRRPPIAMHTDGVSEGERGNTDDEQKPDADTPPPEEPVLEKLEIEPTNDLPSADAEDITVTPTATRSRRRSRSRSRSRTSKDLKGKAKSVQSPAPSPLPGDSSQDEASPALPSVPPLMSPVPSHVAAIQSRLLRSPTPTLQDLSMLPYPVSPPTPLPSLEALSKNLNLYRSNSAGRMMAMHKLTGGTESYEPSLSPSPTPPVPGKFRRNNTVSGGERNAARNKMFTALANRSNKDTDGEMGSGGDEQSAPSPSPTPKRRRRRSRRSSAAANANNNPTQSDSDWISTTHNTPQVPPTPLPDLPPDIPVPIDWRARSVTPNHMPQSARSPSPGRKSESPYPATSDSGLEYERPEPPRRRSVLIEEEEDDGQSLPQPRYLTPSTPPQPHYPFTPPHHAVEPSTDSESTSAVGVPIYLSSRGPSRQDQFPSSPYITPSKEQRELIQDEEYEEVIYPADTSRYRAYEDVFDREISWIASPVPEIRMPVNDDEGDEYEEEDQDQSYQEQSYDDPGASPRSSYTPPEGYSRDDYENPSPRDSSDSQNVLVVESETSPEVTPAHVPSPPPSAPLPSSIIRVSDDSTSSSVFHRIPSPGQGERLPLSSDFTELEDRSLDPSGKRAADVSSPSAWEKVKNTFTRSNSSAGRRSRTNSLATRERRDNTDSSISRESGASQNSGKTDKPITPADASATFAVQQAQAPLTQSTSASASYVSLASPVARGGASPVPPPSADLSKYQNSKLFPFPGIKKLEEQRNRAKGYSASNSTPDINLGIAGTDDEQQMYANTLGQVPTPMGRDRQLQHQTSETALGNGLHSPQMSISSPQQTSYPEYFDIPQSPHHTPNSSSSKLPMTLPGVKQWLSNKKLFSGQTSAPTSPLPAIPTGDNRSQQNGFKKPSLSDLLRRKESELVPEWDDLSASVSGSSLTSKPVESKQQEDSVSSPRMEYAVGEGQKVNLNGSISAFHLKPSPQSASISPEHPPPAPSPPDITSSATPDPSSSLSDYPSRETSESSSVSSRYSHGVTEGANQGSVVLGRLDENLARGSRSPMWTSAVENTPRKFLFSSPVLQVVNSNIVKDRFLFLFSDLLVIAKPVFQDDDIPQHTKPAMERKFVVKNVVMLRNLRFTGDRAEMQTKQSGSPRSPLIRSFIHQFSKSPDQAISVLLAKTGFPDDPVFIAQLLFKTIELDRQVLGEYLARRTSKHVLKNFVDNFGFVGLKLHVALRIFLLSIHVPSKSPSNPGALEYLLDMFANRWYEANAGIVAYPKDLAVRIVRALVQLNALMHGDIADEPGPTGYPLKHIQRREFIDAFRRAEPRNLISEDVLEDMYDSIRYDRLLHSPVASQTQDLAIVLKRPMPPRLTYKVQSEPIVVRIPQADPGLHIQLYGQDLIFEPQVLTFHKSSEASFRVTGTALGVKNLIMARAGPSALKYSGLPLSSPLTVERAFMRNTFQVAFQGRMGSKRRYMFSLDDGLMCHHWASSLKRQIELMSSSVSVPLSSTSPGPTKFHRAAEIMAFRVLQDTLIGQENAILDIDKALRQLSDANERNGSRLAQQSSVSTTGSNGRFIPTHTRSKSRSKVYHRHGAGRNELELNGFHGMSDSRDSGKDGTPLFSEAESTRLDAPVWTGREIELQCLQNSSISLVLSFLQVGAPDHGLYSM